jgi:hypothetical protein
MSSYADTAWGYDVDNIGYEPGTTNRFVPDSKELKLFKEEKSNMYKGTWMICLVYGLSALTLLGVVFLTEWGKTYVYEKFLPAVLTFVIGAIFIIVYLLFSIFALQPRKIGKGFDTTTSCPDYWKLKKVDSVRQDAIINNNEKYDADSNCPEASVSGSGCDLTINRNDTYHIKDRNKNSIVNKDSKHIKFKCVPDPNVLGNSIYEYKNMKQQLDNTNVTYYANTYANAGERLTTQLSKDDGGSGEPISAMSDDDKDTARFNKKVLEDNSTFLYKNAKIVKSGRDSKGKDIKYSQYIDGVEASDKLLKYASLTGAYKSDWKRTPADFTSNIESKPFNGSFFVDRNSTYEKNPLICNEIYPGLLDELEEVEGEDKLKCELAKTCGISWSKLDCD